MFASIKSQIKTIVTQGIEQCFDLKISSEQVTIEICKHETQGDYASNVCFLLAKTLKQSPQSIGETLCQTFQQDKRFSSVTFAQPGFINFRCSDQTWQQVLPMILQSIPGFFNNQSGENKKVYLEYVSSNPTGPLHVGHARCAVLGSSLTACYQSSGYKVHTEYLINDAGFQIQTLALSVWCRHQESHCQWPFPQTTYQGSYIKTLAKTLSHHPLLQSTQSIHFDDDLKASTEEISEPTSGTDAWFESALKLYHQSFPADMRSSFEDACTDAIMHIIREDCHQLQVSFDTWFSEKSLHRDGSINSCLQKLAPHTYEKDGALWFASSKLGDSKDRVLRRSNGEITYFAADCAYHLHKLKQKPDIVINIFGADHHGYVPRIKAAVQCLSERPVDFEVLIYQFVNLFKQGKPVQMSTRSGEFITLSDLVNEIGSDCTRFYLLNKHPDQHIDFDLDEAKAQSQDNPLYRIHYAYVRTKKLIESHQFSPDSTLNKFNKLNHSLELSLLKQLEQFPDQLKRCVQENSLHPMCHYLLKLSGHFHSYYSQVKINGSGLENQTQRLHLIHCVSKVLTQGLKLLKIQPREQM